MFSKADKAKATSIPARSVPSLVSTDLEITGDLKTPGEVQLDGTIEGNGACGKLMVGEKACITGLVEADEVVIRGKIIGRVKAHSVELAKTAHVVGDIWHDTLAVDAGAFLDVDAFGGQPAAHHVDQLWVVLGHDRKHLQHRHPGS